MKKYTLIPLFLVFLCILGLSWQGELNPTDFDKWGVVRILKQDAQYAYVIAKNRDEASLIRLVILTIRKEDRKVMAYGYFKHGEVFMFKYYEKADQYKRVEMQEWENKRCLGCHQDELDKKKPLKERKT